MSVFRIVYPFPEGRVDVILILELDVEMIFRGYGCRSFRRDYRINFCSMGPAVT